jgi:hypothetical protein
VIRLTDINGLQLLFAAGAIASVSEQGNSQRWHGVGANVLCAVTGRWIEVRESFHSIQQQLADEEQRT